MPACSCGSGQKLTFACAYSEFGSKLATCGPTLVRALMRFVNGTERKNFLCLAL